MSWRHGHFPFQRKRTLSSLDDEEGSSHKRLRRQSTIPFDTPMSSLSPGPSRTGPTRTRSLMEEGHDTLVQAIHSSPRRPRLSGASSFVYSNSPSRASSIAGDAITSGFDLIRTSSMSDIRRKRESMTPAEPTYAPHSAYHVLRSVNTIDYSLPSVADAAPDSAPASPVSWSQSNAVVFGRGNRVHYKNMADTEDVAQQLCKITSGMGNLRLIQCGGKDQSNIVALATSNGWVQLWDLVAKKMVVNWKMKSVTFMCFGENVLTVGDEKGTLRHYDPRATDNKVKEQLKKATRHQARITQGAWKEDSKLLATGDQNGLVLVWDARRSRVPLEVGEMVQRRRKMQHVGAVTALAWCPWQTKHLVTGDSTAEGSGTIRVWDVIDESPSTEWPTKIELDAQVTSLHFSPHIRELLSTHGPGKATPAPTTPTTPITPMDDPFASASIQVDPLRSRISNSVVVHQFPTMRHVTTMSVAQKNVAGSVLSPNGHRIVFAVPEESQLKVWEVWGKFKAPKPPSLYETCAIR